ncbi:MAG: DUF362 domain-containing protein [Labilithrix sp.]|nr:DUF362 domain-containing protein [Labilithrix sp.]
MRLGLRPLLGLGALAAVTITGCPREQRRTERDSVAPVAAREAGDAGAKARSPATVSSSPVDVVSSASQGGTGWDAGPKVTGAGEVDGAALRARHRARIAGDTSAVTLLQGGSPRELGARICEAAVPARPKETPILIKPNIGGFEWFKDPAKSGGDDGVRGRTTDPEFVRGVVQCLKARGHTKITIAEGWGAKHTDWKRLVRVSGYQEMADDESVPLVAMDDDGVFDVVGDQPGKPMRVSGMEGSGVPTLLMPKILAEHLERGMFISAPKMKAHRFGVVSMGIKGMQGTVMLSDAAPAFHQKWRTHAELGPALRLLERDRAAGERAYLHALEVFAERMVDVLEVSAPDVVLAEGAPAMGGDGFAKRWPSAEDVAVGGTNPVLVDRVGAAVLGLWDSEELAQHLGGHRTSPLIEAAAKRFALDLRAPRIEGDGKALADERARPVHFVSMSGFALHSDDRAPESAPGGPREASARTTADGGGPDASARTADGPDASARTADGGALPEARARRLDAPIVVDGVIDEAWRTAPPVSFSTDWSGAETGIRTRVRFAWSERAFYTLWELEGAGVDVDASRPRETERAKLYEEDCVELFLGQAPGDRTRYYEVEVGPLGHFLDVAIDRAAKKSDVGWSSAPEIATKVDRDARRVTIEVALRAPEIVRALAPGAVLPLALYRMEGKSPRRYLAWSPTRTPKPNFHVPDAFGTLRLE